LSSCMGESVIAEVTSLKARSIRELRVATTDSISLSDCSTCLTARTGWWKGGSPAGVEAVVIEGTKAVGGVVRDTSPRDLFISHCAYIFISHCAIPFSCFLMR
ncbi:hypothetical protein PFISCL1PPCAC_26772, partial [Pristionchus fissidentatus]